jgi:hypothetical protein
MCIGPSETNESGRKNSRKEKPERGLAERFVTNAVVAAAAAVIGAVGSWYFELGKARVDDANLAINRNQSELQILSLIRTDQTPLALHLIDYFSAKYGKDDKDYDALLKSLSDYVATTPQPLTALDQASGSAATAGQVSEITAAVIRQQFSGPARRRYAEYIASIYRNSADQNARNNIVNALAAAFLTDTDMKYRVNIYIALTLSLLPSDALAKAGKASLLQALANSSEMADHTFSLNVEAAKAQQRT